MFLDDEYTYLTKLEKGNFKLELYDTGKRIWWFKKVYAYQVFENNNLVYEDENFVPGWRGPKLGNLILDQFNVKLLNRDNPAIDYVEEFVPV